MNKFKIWFRCKVLKKHNFKPRTLYDASRGKVFVYQCIHCGEIKKVWEW